MKIQNIHARYIYDSRGYPTVEADVVLEDGNVGRAAVPSGASTGSGEALELRDGGEQWRGKGVTKAVDNVNAIIAPALRDQQAWDQFAIDTMLLQLDGTENKSKLGANAILAVSLAVAKAMALSSKMPLYKYIAQMADVHDFVMPLPMFNVLNGGKHATRSMDMQECMIVPTGAATFADAVRMASEVFHALKEELASHKYATTVGDEGGYAPFLHGGTMEALRLVEAAVERAGYEMGTDVAIALDVAASELQDGDMYHFAREQKRYRSDELIARYGAITEHYPVVSIEDGLGEQDWEGWQKLNMMLGNRVQLVGDDLLVTNTALLEKAIQLNAANAILIKPNQIGTLMETVKAVKTAQAAGWRTVMSHRSGETEDTTIAHLAVGLRTGQIKTGSMSRSERLAKYNELLRIQELEPGAQVNQPFHVEPITFDA